MLQLVDQVKLARAQLGKYSEQLATWARIEADTSPDLTARQSLSVQVNSDFVASLNDPDGDGYLTPGELAAGRLLRKSRNSRTPKLGWTWSRRAESFACAVLLR